MRKAEKEIKDNADIEQVLHRAEVCRIGLCRGNEPYVVPMNFGYQDRCLYLHSAKEGKKIEFIKANNKICFEVGVDYEVKESENPCNWSMNFSSVIGLGKAYIIEDLEEKKKALDVIMGKYSCNNSFSYLDKAVEQIAIIKVKIEEITGKRSGI
ncbi:MAG: pyridoxamine 5'-phosphate oxidase [Desulfitibacter sp. BRH_c19]|nr:MAG: pyridoxamine 5'-phosphate oxidase [Desulfitibacter sp. BRH_c19]